ncbi:MAG: hypothetical protein ULS35scaffold63_44 [Phage 33_17]|nr:MAG: hypothetical protein ULS35scaffold63_44 [Phage 33_17]
MIIGILELNACHNTQKTKPDIFCNSLYYATYTQKDLEIISNKLLKFLDDYQSFYKIHCYKS